MSCDCTSQLIARSRARVLYSNEKLGRRCTSCWFQIEASLSRAWSTFIRANSSRAHIWLLANRIVARNLAFNAVSRRGNSFYGTGSTLIFDCTGDKKNSVALSDSHIYVCRTYTWYDLTSFRGTKCIWYFLLSSMTQSFGSVEKKRFCIILRSKAFCTYICSCFSLVSYYTFSRRTNPVIKSRRMWFFYIDGRLASFSLLLQFF